MCSFPFWLLFFFCEYLSASLDILIISGVKAVLHLQLLEKFSILAILTTNLSIGQATAVEISCRTVCPRNVILGRVQYF